MERQHAGTHEGRGRKGVDGARGQTEYRNEDGLLHRADGPAVIKPDGSRYWFQHGWLHREDGPAVSEADGSEAWYLHGWLHRRNAPRHSPARRISVMVDRRTAAPHRRARRDSRERPRGVVGRGPTMPAEFRAALIPGMTIPATASGNGPVQVNSLLDYRYRPTNFKSGRYLLNSGAPYLNDVRGDVLMICDDWPVVPDSPLIVRAPTGFNLPSARVLAFRDRGRAYPERSWFPKEFPAEEAVKLQFAVDNCVGAIRGNLSWTSQKALWNELDTIRRRVRRWSSMAIDAQLCEFWRVRFEGVHAVAVKVLELAQIAKMTTPWRNDPRIPAPVAKLEQMERLTREWEYGPA